MAWAPALSNLLFISSTAPSQRQTQQAQPVHVEEGKLREMPRHGWHRLPKLSTPPPQTGESGGTAPALAFTAGLQAGLLSEVAAGSLLGPQAEKSSEVFLNHILI